MVNVTRTFVNTVTALLATSLGGGGSNTTTTTTGITSSSPPTPIIIGTTSSVFDNAGAEYAVLDLPLCSSINSTATTTTYRGGNASGGVTFATYHRNSNNNMKRGHVNNSAGGSFISGSDESGHDGSMSSNSGELLPRNESELIYGTDMEPVMRSGNDVDEFGVGTNRRNGGEGKSSGEVTIEDVKYLTYAILWPTICGFGIVGNILNLIVLNQPNMKGTAYIYMRGYSSAALMAITVAIPFANRVLRNNELGPWTNFFQAFFHTHLELYLGNSCLGIGVMMLVALTMERFVAVCHPEKSRALQGSKKAYIIIASIPICTFLTYSPHLFLSTLYKCATEQGVTIYQKKSNQEFIQSAIFPIYKWFLGLVFRLIPTILLAYLNLRIIIAYRRTCARRRIMTGKTTRDENKKFAEESRIMLLLGSTSVLFFACVTPMVILSVMISDKLLKSFSFQVFRATANLLEVTNYSLTFYIYCLFSREFRNTFLGLLRISKRKGSLAAGPNGPCCTPTNKPSGGATNGTNRKVSEDPAAISGVQEQKGGGSCGSTPLL